MPLIEAPAATVEWGTPPELFSQLHARFHFDLDVCAQPWNAKCACYFTPADDALTRSWAPHTCWMNPPYGKTLSLWLAKARCEAIGGATVVCLIPGRTDNRWWHNCIAPPQGRVLRLGYGVTALGQVMLIGSEGMVTEITFIRGRVCFVRPDGTPADAPTYPSAVVVFAPPGITLPAWA